MMQKKSILITGASSGFGLLTADLALRRGYTVIAGVRGGRERLDTILEKSSRADLFHEKSDSKKLHVVDLHLDQEETFAALHPIIDEFCAGQLDVLINNAGYALMGPGIEHDPVQLRTQMEVNFFGPVLLFQNLITPLERAKGRIINVSSLAGRVGFPFYGAYNASKFAMVGYFEALSYELDKVGIKVSIIEPGGFKTNFTSSLQFSEKSTSAKSRYQKEMKLFQEQIHKKTKQYAGDPSDVAELIIKVAEEKSPPLHLVIGRDAKLLWFFYRTLPFKWFYTLQKFFFNRLFLG